ncbi:MAG: 7,8-didemethyl-8-hydroxy-5-deazariboflavin synthase subunit CofH, partial [bacterium]
MWDDVRAVVQDPRSLEQLLAAATPVTAQALAGALDRTELSAEDGERLLAVEGDDLVALVHAADAARAADVGDEVTYVVNRNINWTNICFVGCQFCA